MVTQTHKRCSVCKETLPRAAFVLDRKGAALLSARCRPCSAKYVKVWRANNVDKVRRDQRASHVRREYGLGWEEYERMHQEQFGCCAICFSAIDLLKTTHVDHCHSSGRIRGLLCLQCNSGLGQFEDDTERLMRAIMYLRER